jgi:hypothetical protein
LEGFLSAPGDGQERDRHLVYHQLLAGEAGKEIVDLHLVEDLLVLLRSVQGKG